MIFTYIVTAVIVFISLLIQSHPAFDVIRIAGIKPDLVFIMVVYTGYSFGSMTGQLTGFAGGLFQDAISNSPYGFLALPKLVIGFIIGMIGRSMLKSNIPTVLLLIFVATLLKGVISLIISYVFAQGMLSSIIHVIIPEAFYNALLAPPLFALYDKIFSRELEREGYL